MNFKVEKKLINFFKNVNYYLGIHDWDITFNGDSYCWYSEKNITIDQNYKGDVKQIILHEIAHINTARFSNQKHNPQFWKHLEFLTIKFLKRKLDKSQINHKRYMTDGIYSLCYENKKKL